MDQPQDADNSISDGKRCANDRLWIERRHDLADGRIDGAKQLFWIDSLCDQSGLPLLQHVGDEGPGMVRTGNERR